MSSQKAEQASDNFRESCAGEACDASVVGTQRRTAELVVDADIRRSFSNLRHDCSIRMREWHVGDSQAEHPIIEGLNAGVKDSTGWSDTSRDVPLGRTVSSC